MLFLYTDMEQKWAGKYRHDLYKFCTSCVHSRTHLTTWNFSYVTFVQPHKQETASVCLAFLFFLCFCLQSSDYKIINYDRNVSTMASGGKRGIANKEITLILAVRELCYLLIEHNVFFPSGWPWRTLTRWNPSDSVLVIILPNLAREGKTRVVLCSVLRKWSQNAGCENKDQQNSYCGLLFYKSSEHFGKESYRRVIGDFSQRCRWRLRSCGLWPTAMVSDFLQTFRSTFRFRIVRNYGNKLTNKTVLFYVYDDFSSSLWCWKCRW